MRRACLALGLALLSGCPIPQAVPEVGLVPGGGSLVPAPRIVPERVRPSGTFIDVSRSCPEAPTIRIEATISEFDNSARPEARWFIDYDPVANFGVQATDLPSAPSDSTDTYRPVAPFPFRAARWQDPATPVQVVELVVSNGFLAGLGGDFPNRTPQANNETQVFRWVIRYVASGGLCAFP